MPTTGVASASILLVEDDLRLAALIKEYLEQQGLRVSTETRGDCATDRILRQPPDLLILDVMLPGRDGFEVCKAVRGQFAGPILMLTARDEDIDQVVGLELGADDYVTKPVQPRVLLARIRALLRRQAHHLPDATPGTNGGGSLVLGPLRICRRAREAQFGPGLLDLTTNEFELLWLLASHAGQILSRDAILAKLRGIGYDGLDRSVDLRVSKLRRKLGDNPHKPAIIKTVRGKGYLFVATTWS